MLNTNDKYLHYIIEKQNMFEQYLYVIGYPLLQYCRYLYFCKSEVLFFVIFYKRLNTYDQNGIEQIMTINAVRTLSDKYRDRSICFYLLISVQVPVLVRYIPYVHNKVVFPEATKRLVTKHL